MNVKLLKLALCSSLIYKEKNKKIEQNCIFLNSLIF